MDKDGKERKDINKIIDSHDTNRLDILLVVTVILLLTTMIITR